MNRKPNESPLYSIVIAVYQIEDYIRNCIDSILMQDFKDYEIILVDDGSKDKSGEICDFYSDKYNNIITIHQENAGLSQARNNGIRLAKGEYCVLVDGDDFLQDKGLANLAEAICKYDYPDIILNRRISYKPATGEYLECKYKYDEKYCKLYNSCEIYNYIYTLPQFLGTAWIVVTKISYLLSQNLFFVPGLLHEDEEWFPKTVLNAETIGFNNEPFYCYREERAGSIKASHNIKRSFDIIKIIDIMQSWINEEKYTLESRKALMSRSSQLMIHLLLHLKQYADNTEYSSLKKQIKQRAIILWKSDNRKRKLWYLIIKMIGPVNVGNWMRRQGHRRQKG